MPASPCILRACKRITALPDGIVTPPPWQYNIIAITPGPLIARVLRYLKLASGRLTVAPFSVPVHPMRLQLRGGARGALVTAFCHHDLAPPRPRDVSPWRDRCPVPRQ